MDPGVPPQAGRRQQIVETQTLVLDAAGDRTPGPPGCSDDAERQLSAEHRLRERVGERAVNEILLLGDVADGAQVDMAAVRIVDEGQRPSGRAWNSRQACERPGQIQAI